MSYLFEWLPEDNLGGEIVRGIDLASRVSLALTSKHASNKFALRSKITFEYEDTRFKEIHRAQALTGCVDLSSASSLLLHCLHAGHLNLFRYFVDEFQLKTKINMYDFGIVEYALAVVGNSDLFRWFLDLQPRYDLHFQASGNQHPLLEMVLFGVGLSNNNKLLQYVKKRYGIIPSVDGSGLRMLEGQAAGGHLSPNLPHAMHAAKLFMSAVSYDQFATIEAVSAKGKAYINEIIRYLPQPTQVQALIDSITSSRWTSLHSFLDPSANTVDYLFRIFDGDVPERLSSLILSGWMKHNRHSLIETYAIPRNWHIKSVEIIHSILIYGQITVFRAIPEDSELHPSRNQSSLLAALIGGNLKIIESLFISLGKPKIIDAKLISAGLLHEDPSVLKFVFERVLPRDDPTLSATFRDYFKNFNFVYGALGRLHTTSVLFLEEEFKSYVPPILDPIAIANRVLSMNRREDIRLLLEHYPKSLFGDFLYNSVECVDTLKLIEKYGINYDVHGVFMAAIIGGRINVLQYLVNRHHALLSSYIASVDFEGSLFDKFHDRDNLLEAFAALAWLMKSGIWTPDANGYLAQFLRLSPQIEDSGPSKRDRIGFGVRFAIWVKLYSETFFSTFEPPPPAFGLANALHLVPPSPVFQDREYKYEPSRRVSTSGTTPSIFNFSNNSSAASTKAAQPFSFTSWDQAAAFQSSGATGSMGMSSSIFSFPVASSNSKQSQSHAVLDFGSQVNSPLNYSPSWQTIPTSGGFNFPSIDYGTTAISSSFAFRFSAASDSTPSSQPQSGFSFNFSNSGSQS